MKTKTILAFKKSLSKIENYEDIQWDESILINKHIPILKNYLGYINIKINDFHLSMMMGKCSLKYKTIFIELTISEWEELRILVKNKCNNLLSEYKKEDEIEILNILKS